MRRAVTAGFFALALAGANGCGDDGGRASSPVPGDDTTATSVNPVANGGDGLVRVAVFVNASGQILGGEQNVVPVLEAWADEVNGSGGLAGRRVEFVFEDTLGDPSIGTAAAERTAGDESIAAAFVFDAGTESVYGRTLSDAGIPIVGGMGYDPTLWVEEPNWLSVATTFPGIINAAMVIAEDRGATTTALAVCAETPNCDAIEPIAAAATEALGMTFGGMLKIAAAAPDFTAECLEIINRDVDFIVGGHVAAVDMRFFETCATQGYQGRFGMTGGAIEPRVLAESPADITVDMALNAFPWWTDEPAVVAYRELMESHDVEEFAWGDLRGTAAYASAELLRVAVEGAADLPATLRRADLVAAYDAVDGEHLDGLLPAPASFTPAEAHGPVPCYWFATYEDGEFTGGEPACDPDELE